MGNLSLNIMVAPQHHFISARKLFIIFKLALQLNLLLVHEQQTFRCGN